MGTIYRTNSYIFGVDIVGSYSNGIIYRGPEWGGALIGSYSNGDVYSGAKWGGTLIGSYSNGCVYRLGGTQIGSYSNGCIFQGFGLYRTQVGSYDGEDGGAASAGFLLLLQQNSNVSYENRSSNNGSDEVDNTVPYNSKVGSDYGGNYNFSGDFSNKAKEFFAGAFGFALIIEILNICLGNIHGFSNTIVDLFKVLVFCVIVGVVFNIFTNKY